MSAPEYSPSEALSHDTFMALLHASSRPGLAQSLPTASYPENFFNIAETLIDLETSFFASDETLRETLQRRGGLPAPVDAASYQLWHQLDDSRLKEIEVAPAGSMIYPDRGASLYIGCKLDEGTALQLTGPGIESQLTVKIRGIPAAFWAKRNAVCQFPLGWDLFLIDGDRVMAVPRSTRVEIIQE